MNSDGRNPKCPFSTTHFLLSVQLSTKYKIRMSNLCAQHDTLAELKHRDIVTCSRVNAVRTILQLTLVTHGHLLRVRLFATKGTYIPIVTHNILIIIVLLCRCGPYMCGYMFPWTIWRVPYLSSNQKLLQMQEYMHVLMQLSTGSPPYVPYNAPMLHACKQVLRHPCILRAPQTKGDKMRIGCLTPAFSGAQKRAKMLCHPCILGGPQTKGDNIRIGCLTPAFSGAQKSAKMRCQRYVLR